MAKSSEQFPPSQPPERLLEEAKALLQQGLEAAKRKAYSEAIASFQTLQASTTPAPYRLQARVGLARTFWQMGEKQKALTLCQSLARHPNEQVKRWAEKMLATAETDVSTAQETTSFPAASSPVMEVNRTAPEKTERSHSQDLSGFTPLTPTTTDKQAVPSAPSSPTASVTPTPKTHREATPTVESHPAELQTLASSQATLPSSDPEIIPATSLFHYQQLNGGFVEPIGPVVKASPAPEIPLSTEESGLSSNVGEPAQPISVKPSFRPLPPLNPIKLWSVGVLTALAVFWLVRWLAERTEGVINWVFQQIHRFIPAVPSFWFDHSFTIPIAVGLIGLILASPWLFDYGMRWLYGQKSLSIQQLKLQKPETLKTVRRFCQKQGWPLSAFRVLPSQAPLCFSYGWRPQNLRLVFSQGLLDQFEDVELATLSAYEMGHLKYWDVPLMSGLGALLLLIHQGYWQTAQWGDRQSLPVFRGGAAVLSSLLYGVFWLVRKAGLWFSRLRSEYCDRTAIELTQNPEAYSRSLLKLTQGLAAHIEEQGYTPPLLESLDLLTPLSHQLALSPGSCLSEDNLAELTVWDRQNPYRHWLLANTPQSLLGNRLALLQRYGASLDLEASIPQSASRRTRAASSTTAQFSLLILFMQGAPIFGLLIGLAIAMVLWFLGGVVNAFDWWFLSWLYQDISILKASAFLGFGIGLLLRVNRLFPEIRTPLLRSDPALEDLLNQPKGLPIDSQPIQLQGVLIGRPGIANWLCQDVILKTSSGLIKLHISSPFGPVGNFFSPLAHPENWKDQAATIRGWARRGATLWLDVERCQVSGRVLALSNHPLWTTLLSLAACLWGVKILFKGY